MPTQFYGKSTVTISSYREEDGCDVYQVYRETPTGLYLTTFWRIPGRYLAQRTRDIMKAKVNNRLITWRRVSYGDAPATMRKDSYDL